MNKRYITASKYASRPKVLLEKLQGVLGLAIDFSHVKGFANAQNPLYIKWLKSESMLRRAKRQTSEYSGKAFMWKHAFSLPKPREVIRQASVWYTAYPMSLIGKKDDNMLQAMSHYDLWSYFEHIGVEAMHTGPMKLSGGIKGWKYTPSIDGHFDRVGNRIDPVFGSSNDFRRLVEMAGKHGAVIIDDLVPGHTGKGADFRLAEYGYNDYPGIYHMVEILPRD